MSGGKIEEIGISSVLKDGQSPEVKNALSPAPHNRSAFERLPLEIRNQIYGYLLRLCHVKEASSDLGVATYKFHTAILATNRYIAPEARSIFQENIFIVLSIDDAGTYTNLRREGVPIVSRHCVASFKDHLLRAYVKFPKLQAGSLETFLLMAEDLPKLCRYIRLQNLIFAQYSYGIKVHLELRSPTTRSLALSIQKLLLEPFKQAYCGLMRASITGCVDDSYGQEILSKMKPDEYQANKEGWIAYQMGKEMKQEGDRLFRLGKSERVKERYVTSNVISGLRRHSVLDIMRKDDSIEWQAITLRLLVRTSFNALLLNIQSQVFNPSIIKLVSELLNHNNTESIGLSDYDLARVSHCYGLILGQFGRNRAASAILTKTLQRSDTPENSAIEESLRLLRDSLDGVLHNRITQRVLGDPILIMEESGGDSTKKEFEVWQKLTGLPCSYEALQI